MRWRGGNAQKGGTRSGSAGNVNASADVSKNVQLFKDLSAGLQSLAIVLSLFVGGAWAYFRFVYVESPEAQRTQRDAARFGSLDISVSIDPIRKIDDARYLVARVKIKNIGDRVVWLDLPKNPILVIKVVPDELGNVRYTEGVTFPLAVNPALSPEMRTIMPNRQIELSGITMISNPGFYLISFSAPVRDSDREQGSSSAFEHVWEQSTVVHVE